jgi:hypothetical protein
MTNQRADRDGAQSLRGRNHWLSIREAAIALGVSELTVRRRIKDGKVPHRLTSGKYFVNLNGLAPSDAVPAAGRADLEGERGQRTRATSFEVDCSADQVDEAKPAVPGSLSNGVEFGALLVEHARVAEVAGRARLLEEQLRDLEKRHADLQQGALSLASRNGWLESKLEEREASIKLLSDHHQRLSWWRRVFRSHDGGT